jgi:UDP-glucose 4-epimerase
VNIVITGGAGFIGAHVAEAAQAAGHDVRFFDKSQGNDILGDLSGLEGADSVIHLAGVLGTMELFGQIEHAVQTNVVGTYRVAQWCADHDAQLTLVNVPFVFPSIYCATKRGAYEICVAMNKAGMLKMSSVTVYNAFGPGQHTENKEKGWPRKFVPTFATAAWKGEQLPIWGDGTNLIDPIHTSEVARIFVEATQFTNGEVFDAGTGNEFSVNEIAEFIIQHTGTGATILHEPMRVGETPTNVGATGLGWDLLSAPPKFTWQQLADTVDWYKGHQEH